VTAEPIADATLVRVDASATVGAGSVEMRWDWENDGVFDTPYAQETQAEHLYASPGMYTIRLEVRGATSAETTRSVQVSPQLALTPIVATITLGESVSFTAKVTGCADHGVQWSVDNGTITAGVFTPPNAPGRYTVTAACRAAPDVNAMANVEVVAGGVEVAIQ
jgi:PKD repeat protein